MGEVAQPPLQGPIEGVPPLEQLKAVARGTSEGLDRFGGLPIPWRSFLIAAFLSACPSSSASVSPGSSAV